MRTRAVLGSALLLACGACATAAEPPAPPVELTAQEDHQRLMGLLGLDSIRPGRNGMDPSHPNYANYDEATANIYPDLPELLVTEDGTPVTTVEMWEEVRRPELVELFNRKIYGFAPDETPAVTWEVVAEREEEIAGVRAIVRDYAGKVDNSAYLEIEVNLDMTVTTPADAEGPVPAVLSFTFRFPANWEPPPNWSPPTPSATERILSRGWAHVEFVPTSAQADNGAGLTQGIIGLVNKGQPRDLDDWGALRAWAWGASRALDQLIAMPEIDGSKVAVEGLSRYGKAVLVTMAYEPRFAIGFAGSSGEGGGSLYRRDNGEILENVAGSGEYHWMAGNFIRYAADPMTWDDLPIDAHMLIALAAPRPLFVGTGTNEAGDAWVDPVGTFMATRAATPAYELYGLEGVTAADFPGPMVGLTDGTLAFRQQEGGHSNHLNWESFLDFASRWFEQ